MKCDSCLPLRWPDESHPSTGHLNRMVSSLWIVGFLFLFIGLVFVFVIYLFLILGVLAGGFFLIFFIFLDLTVLLFDTGLVCLVSIEPEAEEMRRCSMVMIDRCVLAAFPIL